MTPSAYSLRIRVGNHFCTMSMCTVIKYVTLSIIVSAILFVNLTYSISVSQAKLNRFEIRKFGARYSIKPYIFCADNEYAAIGIPRNSKQFDAVEVRISVNSFQPWRPSMNINDRLLIYIGNSVDRDYYFYLHEKIDLVDFSTKKIGNGRVARKKTHNNGKYILYKNKKKLLFFASCLKNRIKKPNYCEINSSYRGAMIKIFTSRSNINELIRISENVINKFDIWQRECK